MKAEEPITEYFKLDLNGTYTYWDYLKWHFKERVELIRGKVFKMTPPSPNLSHQTVSMNLTAALVQVFHKTSCRLFSAPFDVRLPIPNEKKDSTVVQPDLFVVCDDQKLDAKGCNGTPDLAIEILSPGNSKYEMNTKFKLYQQAGVKEYWIADPERKLILLYILKNGVLEGLQPFTEGEIITSVLFPNLQINSNDVFHGITIKED